MPHTYRLFLVFSFLVTRMTFAQPGNLTAKIETRTATKGEQRIMVIWSGPGSGNAAYELPVRSQSAKRTANASPIEVGDPLGPETAAAVVTFGEEDRTVSSWLRPLNIPNQTCLLAEQQYGYQVVKRNHTAICVQGGKAEKLWSREEGEGPTWSMVDIDKAGFTYYEGFRTPDGPETLTATAVTWSGTEFREAPATTRTAIAAVFETAAAAREARSEAAAKDPTCAPFWVLPREGTSGFALAADTKKTPAELPNWKEWRSCYPSLKMAEK